MSATLLTLSSERSRHDCAVAKNSNAHRISEFCFIACPQTGVLWSSDDTLCNYTRGLSPQRCWEHARQTASRHSASLPVHELVFCNHLMTLSSATSHGDFLHNVVGRMFPVWRETQWYLSLLPNSIALHTVDEQNLRHLRNSDQSQR